MCYKIAAACQGTGTDWDQFYVNCLGVEGATFYGYTDTPWDKLGIAVKALHFKMSVFQSPKCIFWFYSQIKTFSRKSWMSLSKNSAFAFVVMGGWGELVVVFVYQHLLVVNDEDDDDTALTASSSLNTKG